MQPIRTMVVDDEPLALQLICDYVLKEPALQLVHYTTAPLEGLQWIQDGKIDLVFLDIQMPEINGLQFLRIVQNRCKAILTTAYHEFALVGYKHDVIDYLLKPVTMDSFLIAVEKAKQRIQVSETGKLDYLFVKTEHKIQKISFNDIFYLEALRDYVAIHTSVGKILSLQPLRMFQQWLPNHMFIRIHKSYIVSIPRISFIEKNRIIITDAYLPIGESYKEALLKKISAV